ncbi:putative reverse transcriptase domain-containing protein [Tanacetum coccineum]
MWGEPNKDKNGIDDNKRTRTGNAFATTANPVGRENTGAWPKCTTCNSYHAPEGPCRTCFNCNRPGHLRRDCRVVPRNVNPGHGNQGNQARGGAFILGAEEARQDPNIVTDIPEEDVEPKQIILDPDDQPMWESAKTVAPTPNSAIVQPNVDDNFVINSTHLNMIRENKFDG